MRPTYLTVLLESFLTVPNHTSPQIENFLKGHCHEIFDTVFIIISHPDTLFVLSIFEFGIDFAEIFAGAKISEVSLTLLSQTPRVHWHRGVKLSVVTDAVESKNVQLFLKCFFLKCQDIVNSFFRSKTHFFFWHSNSTVSMTPRSLTSLVTLPHGCAW